LQLPVRPQAPASAFVVDIAALRRKGESRHRIDTELDVDRLRAAFVDTDAEVASPGRIGLDLLVQADGSVVVTGDLSFAFTVPCARCLDPAAVDGSSSITALVVPDGAAAPKSAGANEGDFLRSSADGYDEEDAESDDVWTYDGHTLELLPMISETIKLAYPMRQLCARGSACRGLCSSCGAPLNEQPDGVRACERCGAADPRVPEVDEIPAPGAGAENPLQAALRKLQSRE
jgi:uncharacterized metal-binding protein YceD (DUF177 family)